jgi:hypothetical protein
MTRTSPELSANAQIVRNALEHSGRVVCLDDGRQLPELLTDEGLSEREFKRAEMELVKKGAAYIEAGRFWRFLVLGKRKTRGRAP